MASDALRVLAALIAAWNLRWTFRGVRGLARGEVSPPSVYLSVVFWMSAAVVSFLFNHYVHPNEAWRVLCFFELTIAMGLAAWGHHKGLTLKARQFYSMYDHLGVALAITDLARVDPDGADLLADQARLQYVASLAARHD